MAEFMGFQQYLNIIPEIAWGQIDTGGTSLYVPYTTYGVAAQPQSTQAQLFTGLYERRHNRRTKATLSGQLACPLYGQQVGGTSIAETLIMLAMTRTSSIYLPSITAQKFEAGTDNKTHLGLRVGQMTIAGDSESGIISLTLDLVGKEEEGGASLDPIDEESPQPIEFLFSDAELFLELGDDSSANSGDSLPMRSFSITVNNQAQTYHTNSYWPSHVVAGVREVGFQFSLFKSANTYDALRRSSNADNHNLQLILKGQHGGTGSPGTDFTVITATLPRINFSNATDSAGLNELANQQVDYIVLKPDTAQHELNFAFSEE